MNIKQLKIALGALKRCFYDTRLDNLGFCGKRMTKKAKNSRFELLF